MYGYTGKLIDVDLSKEKIKVVEIDEEILKKFYGGRGLGTYILWKELGERWENVDPLGKENLLLILTGPLTGYYPGMKTAVVSKSPESNGVVGSVLSSEVGIELKASGYDGIIIRGKAREPVYLFVNDDTIEIRDASKYWGMNGVEVVKTLTKDVHEELKKKEKLRGIPKEPAIMYIGKGGENKVRFAAIMTKLMHAAGYGGFGAVMGSKMLKAIVVKGSKALPPVYDKEKFKTMLREFQRELLTLTTFRQWGTGAGGYSVGKDRSSQPVRNWQEEYHDNEEISVVNFELKAWIKKYWADYGCPVNCMKISYLRYGPYKGAITDAPDYELMAYMGTNLGIFEPEKIVYLSYLVDEYGLDGINAGNTLGFAAELYQRGILTKDDLGFELKWGDEKAFAKLLEMIVNKEGIGEILAEGTYRAALKISAMKGVDAIRYAVHVKGIGIGAHGIRSNLDYTKDISYAASVQGGDHTATAGLPARSYEGELVNAFYDSAVICSFVTKPGFEKIIEFGNAVTGFDLTPDKWFNETGLRIIHLQRILLLLGGPDVYWDPRRDDDNPPRFYEPLPSGPVKGKAPTREEIREKLRQYYGEIGYDENGIPEEEVLEELGLEEAKREVKRIKKRLGV
ncbi:aldehyde ferredoxin oxidoreductase [Thermococcus sp. M39]|uniref:aldehyde ferredoxin oxidoreductase family protein n=1 Tax=unclassified Thermococcus TaxID=2627626 RepID=UPI00143949E0|nr:MULTISPECIES: aldehyde ferredoxin oxidoreductase C-terminal domain-containing protein [unclassified Thermococcus]NJE07015.1 aldehyde ferredoxin oxidoreductase [Thermococcus sp. M39]NJE12915.1 aldehyde ferredoxin oxidoreductase [Thermococcus sp. LS2]